MMEDNSALDKLLSERAEPPASPGLAARIIAAAQEKKRPLWHIIMDELNALVLLPKPSYALAACLVVGIVFGLQAETFIALSQEEWGSFLYVEEDWI